MQLPGLMLKLQDGTPIAWAFIGVILCLSSGQPGIVADTETGLHGSLISLHCEVSRHCFPVAGESWPHAGFLT